MTFQRHNWQTGRDGNTPITADALNEIEDGVEDALNLQLGIGAVTSGGQAGASISGEPGDRKLNLTLPTSTEFGYLVAHFGNNNPDYEKLSVNYSPDGKYVAPGIHNPVYAPTGGVRDPHMMKHGDKWYVVYTINNGQQKNFGVASSQDLYHWTLVATPSVASATGISRAWAPELVTDYDGSVYMFFTNNDETNQRLSTWRIKALDANLATWSAPEKVLWATEPPQNVIDPTFLRYKGRWVIFFGNGGTICRASATSITGVWTIERVGDWAGWKAAAPAGTDYEGPSVVQTGPESWRLYMDRYVSVSGGHEFPGYCYTESTDLEHWSTPVSVQTGPGFPGGQVLRHGSFIKLQSAEEQGLVMAATSLGAPLVPHIEMTATNNAIGVGGLLMAPLAVDTARSQRWGDVVGPSANSTFRVKVNGVYTITFTASGSANFGGGWMAIKSPDQSIVYATNDMKDGAPAWSVTAANVMLLAGEEVMVFLAPGKALGAGLTKARVRVTKVG